MLPCDIIDNIMNRNWEVVPFAYLPRNENKVAWAISQRQASLRSAGFEFHKKRWFVVLKSESVYREYFKYFYSKVSNEVIRNEPIQFFFSNC